MSVVEFVGLFTVLIFFGVFAALAVDHIRHESTYDPDRHICSKEIDGECVTWRHKTYCELHPDDENRCVCDEYKYRNYTDMMSVWQFDCVSLTDNETTIFNVTISPDWIRPSVSHDDNWSCEIHGVDKVKINTSTIETCIKAHARQS